jgi:capsular polysaccharide biosynthesis protein
MNIRSYEQIDESMPSLNCWAYLDIFLFLSKAYLFSLYVPLWVLVVGKAFQVFVIGYHHRTRCFMQNSDTHSQSMS